MSESSRSAAEEPAALTEARALLEARRRALLVRFLVLFLGIGIGTAGSLGAGGELGRTGVWTLMAFIFLWVLTFLKSQLTEASEVERAERLVKAWDEAQARRQVEGRAGVPHEVAPALLDDPRRAPLRALLESVRANVDEDGRLREMSQEIEARLQDLLADLARLEAALEAERALAGGQDDPHVRSARLEAAVAAREGDLARFVDLLRDLNAAAALRGETVPEALEARVRDEVARLEARVEVEGQERILQGVVPGTRAGDPEPRPRRDTRQRQAGG